MIIAVVVEYVNIAKTVMCVWILNTVINLSVAQNVII